MTTISTPHPTTESARIDVESLSRRLLGRWAKDRIESRRISALPELQKVEGLTLAEHRARVLQQAKLLVEHGAIQRSFPKQYGGSDNQGGNLAAFQELVVADPSLQIKSGVQWGLFGSAINQLGTESHRAKWLPGVISLEIPGVFAMTETGHGSDVASIATTATYDPHSQEFVINTPFKAAWKDYLGNAALHGKAAVVFAQLETGGERYGVHAFYVPIRGEDGAFLAGVGGEDDGLKGGLNGIDNGRLWFDHVRVPRTNLLNRFGDVAPDGTYSSEIASAGRRFFTMLGTLVQGRVSLDGAAVVASKLGLAIAVTYGNQRRQFDDGTGNETVLLDYQEHQRRLLPRVAEAYAAGFANERLLELFDTVFSGADDSDGTRQDLETLAAALKPLSTWMALDTLQACREACGGAGFLTENRLTSLRADLDVYVTFEGDNTVLLQLVGKRLLSDYQRRFSKPDFSTMAGYAAGQMGERAINRSGLRRLAQTVADFGSTARSVGQLQGSVAQRSLMTDMVETRVAAIAAALRPAQGMSKEDAAALFNEHQHELIETARAHGDLLRLEAFIDAMPTITDPDTHKVMAWLLDLYAFGLLERHATWFLTYGRLSPQRVQSITAYIDRLLGRLRPHAQDLVDAFGYSQDHLRAAISSGAEERRQRESRA